VANAKSNPPAIRLAKRSAFSENAWPRRSKSNCEVKKGLVVGAVQTETSKWEWDGPEAKELSDYGVARKPGDIFAFQHTDDSGEVIPLRRGEFAPLRTSVARPRRDISRDRLLDRAAFRAV
jgi:hypothetical protein